MGVDRSVIGKPTGAWKVTVERGPVMRFAEAVGDDDPIYRDVRVARQAGFANIPAPPTFTFAMSFWGAFPEEQPPDPSGGQNPMHAIMGELFGKGALVLHGEQEFVYHRPVLVGDTLLGEGRIADVYEKDTDTAHMTFVVVETSWRNAADDTPVVTERFNLIARLRNDAAAAGA